MTQTKEFADVISDIAGIENAKHQPDDTTYLESLKILTLEKVENHNGYGIEHDYIRDRFCSEAKRILCKVGHPTKGELDFCFPDYDNSFANRSTNDNEQETERTAETARPPAEDPRRQQTKYPKKDESEVRLKNPPQSKEQPEKIKLSKKDWEWLERANHPLSDRLFFGAVVTPQFIELDLKLGISDSPHRRRLLDYLSLHCDNRSGVTSKFTVEALATALQCGRDKIRESIKWLVKEGRAGILGKIKISEPLYRNCCI